MDAIRRTGAVILILVAQAAATEIDRIVWPADSGVVVATEHGVANDGRDCTVALNALLQEYASQQRVVYLPDGTYLVSDQIVLGRRMFTSLVGESRDGVVIRLRDGCAGFGDPARPRTVLQGSTLVSTAFSVNFVNLTVDTGRGNPGAIGMFFGANNQGSLRNCAIRSGDGAGVIGLDLRDRGVGPLLVQDVAVHGFATGVAVAKCSRCFERLVLEGQREVGMDVEGGLLFMRGVTFRAPAPFMRISEEPRSFKGEAAARVAGRNGMISSIVIDRARLERTGGAEVAAFPAVDVLWLRDVETHGFGTVVGSSRGQTPPPAPGTIDEWCSHPVATLFGTEPRSLRLEVPDPPPVAWDPDLSHWANPDLHRRPEDGDDDAPAIQRAIDSGATTVYFPWKPVPARSGRGQLRRNWRLRTTVEVRGRVSRLIGCGATFVSAGEDMPGLRIGNKGPPVVALQDLRGNFGDKLVILSEAPGRTVVLRQLAACTIEQRGGDLHLQDVVAARVRFQDGRAWCRQLNVERGQPKLRNDGGLLWVLGFKSEQAGAVLDTHGGGSSELLGSFFFCGAGNVPMLRNDNSSVFAAGVAEQVSANHHARGFLTLVREDQGDQTRTVNHFAEHGAVSRGVGSILPAYVGRVAARAAVPRPCVLPDAGDEGAADGKTLTAEPGRPLRIALRTWGGPARHVATGLPPGLACDPVSAVITGTVAAPGRWVVEVRSEGAGGSAATSFILSVGVPELSCPDRLEIRIGEPVSFRLAASHGPCTFAMRLPRGLSCTKDGQLGGTVDDPERVGTFETEVRIDSPAGRISYPFTLEIAP